MIFTIPEYYLDKIEQAVDQVFDKLGQRLTGRVTSYIEGFQPQNTLPRLFLDSSRSQYAPDPKLYQRTLETTMKLLKAHRESTKFKLIKTIQSTLNEARVGTSNQDIAEIIRKELQTVWEKVTNDIDTIVAYESNNIKNLGILDSVIKLASANGIKEPTLYFDHALDEKTCEICIDLFFNSDKITPKVFKLNEIGFGYHKKGDSKPKLGGAHPRCRGILALLLPGYGFEEGKAKFLGNDYDEFDQQRGK